MDMDTAYICTGNCMAALTRPRHCGNPRCIHVSQPLQKVSVMYSCPEPFRDAHGNLLCQESHIPAYCTMQDCKNYNQCKYAMAVVPYSMRIPILDPPEENRSYSSIWGNNAVGTGHARSMISSALGWTAAVNNRDQWMVIDAGSVVSTIGGLMIAGCAESYTDQLVTKFTVEYKNIDEPEWTRLENAFESRLSPESISMIVQFTKPIEARLIRLRPLQWERYISLRCCLVLSGEAKARFIAEEEPNSTMEYRKVIDVNQLPSKVALTSIPGGHALPENPSGIIVGHPQHRYGVLHIPKQDHEWCGRKMKWSVEKFNNVAVDDDSRIFAVHPGQECHIEVAYQTRWRYNPQDYCPGCIVQLYYGMANVFCVGVIEHGIHRHQGNNSKTFTAPSVPGLYYITQSISMQYNFVDNLGCHTNSPSNAFAVVRVLPTKFEESIYPVLPEKWKKQITALLCLWNRSGDDSNVFSLLSRYELYEIFSFLMGQEVSQESSKTVENT